MSREVGESSQALSSKCDFSGFLLGPSDKASERRLSSHSRSAQRGHGHHWIENSGSGVGATLQRTIVSCFEFLICLSLPPRILFLGHLLIHFKCHFLKKHEEKLFINIFKVVLMHTSSSQSFRISFLCNFRMIPQQVR